MEEFPWTFDQFQRYAVLGSVIDVFFSGKTPRLLDVGGVAPTRDGKAYWFPALRISSENTKIVDLAPCTGENFIQGDARALPFPDGLFDLVSALDIIEHIPREGRAQAIGEFCRVTRDMVFLSSPFKDDKIELLENLLFSQIKELFGIEHIQLKEHKIYGLPEIGEVSQELETRGFIGVDFSYGSLENFLFFQSLKNFLMFKENWERMHACIDRFMCRLSSPLEFSGPFSRHFWVYSKMRSGEEMEEGLRKLEKALQSRDHGISLLPLLKDFNQDLIRVLYPESVSALVVTTEKGKNLENCLRHLLTQKVQFNLEVCVWDLRNSPKVKRKVESSFPGVKCLGAEGEKTTREGILEAAFLLKGDYFLFLDENVLLPKDAVQSFLRNSKERGGDVLLTPQISVQKSQIPADTRERNEKVMFWVKNPNKETLEKDYPYAESYDSQRSCWVWSPCLFISRRLLLKKEEDKRALSKESIFLWGNEKEPMRIVFLDDFIVHWVRKEQESLRASHDFHLLTDRRELSRFLPPYLSQHYLLVYKSGDKVLIDKWGKIIWEALPGTAREIWKKVHRKRVKGVISKRLVNEFLYIFLCSGIVKPDTGPGTFFREKEESHPSSEIESTDLISVIVVTHNGKDHVHYCFESLRAQTYPRVEVIAVDNASKDETVSLIKKNFPEVRLFALEKNQHYAGGINYGLKRAQGKYVFILNQDTELEKDCLYNLYLKMKSDEKIGAVVPMLKFFNLRGFLNGIGNQINNHGWGTDNFIYCADVGQFEELKEVPSACFGAVFLSRDALDDVGAVDEGYRSFYEDADWSFRCWLRGWKIVPAPRAVVYHKFGASYLEKAKLALVVCNRLRLVLKIFQGRILLGFLKNYLKEDLKNFVSLVKIRKKDLVFSYLKAYLFLAWSFPGILSKRISLMRSKLKDVREHHVVEKNPSFYCCLNPGLCMPEISVPVILRYYRWEFLRQGHGDKTEKNQS